MHEQSSPEHEWPLPGMRIVFTSRAAESWFIVFNLFVGLPALVLFAREVIIAIGGLLRLIV
jgi:hypothetical protein